MILGRWSEAEKRTLQELYPHRSTGKIADLLDRPVRNVSNTAFRLGLSKTPEYLASPDACRLRRGDQVGLCSRFLPGHAPANKGLRRPGWYRGRMRETQFKKGHRPANYLPLGAVRTDSDGYVRIKIADGIGGFGNPRVWAYRHKLVWEQAHGPIPEGHRIWFKDGVHHNCALGNLELLTGPEHMARTSVHNLPAPLREVIRLNAALKRKVKEAT